MSVQHGANLGLLVGANDGDSYGDDFRQFLRAVDALVFPFVLSLTTTAPPANPADGDRYVVPPGATDGWAGRTNAIASWTLEDPANPSGVWEFFPPKAGFEVTAPGTAGSSKVYIFNGSTWELQGGGSGSSIELMHDGADNGSQTRLNLKSGSNVTLTDDGSGGITIASSGGPGGSIDLRHNGIENGSQTLLNLKAGANLAISDDGAGGITLAATQPTLPTFKTNGTTNGTQSLLNLKNGSNVTISDDGSGGITISASGGGGASIDLQHDGAENGSQTKLNLKSGSNVSITDDGAGGLTITATQPTPLVLQHDGSPNGSQSKLNLRSGANVSIADDGFGGLTIATNDPHLPVLQVAGVNNGSQDLLNLKAGANLTITDDGAGGITIAEDSTRWVQSSLIGKPGAGQTVLLATIPYGAAILNNLSGLLVSIGTLPTATARYQVFLNGSMIAQITISTTGTITVQGTGGQSIIAANDRITITAPATQDATLSDVVINLKITKS